MTTGILSTPKYQPLKKATQEIRVLQVHPAMVDPASDIYCTIIHLPLNGRKDTDTIEDPPPFSQPELSQSNEGQSADGYAALSYVWGSPEPAQTVFLNDIPCKVTPNLAEALRRFRDSGSYLWLWIDALCINQRDKEEVEQQVGMMGLVYKKASQVFMWLGASDSHSDKAMDILGGFSTRLRELHPSLDAKPNWMGLRKLLPKRNFADSRIIKRLFERTYFQRVWTLQEMVLNPRSVVYCGTKIIDWMYVCLSLEPEFAGVPLDESPFMTILFSLIAERHVTLHLDRITVSQEPMPKGSSWLMLLMIARERKTSVAIDHIFGVLGMLEDYHPSIRAEYGKSTHAICREVVQHWIENEHSLDILSACKGWTPSDHENPSSQGQTWESWIPDWTKSGNINPDPKDSPGFLYLIADPYADHEYNAAGNTEMKATVRIASSQLICQGIEFDTITWVDSKTPYRSIFKHFGLYEEAFPEANPYGESRQKLLAYISTRALGKCGDWQNSHSKPLHGLYQCLYTIFKTSLNVDGVPLEEGKQWLSERGIDFDSLLLGKEVCAYFTHKLTNIPNPLVEANQASAICSLPKIPK